MSKARARLEQSTLSQQLLKTILHYNPETGDFTWLQRASRRVLSGSLAGRTDSRGYRRIRILGGDFRAHRLAWLYVYGEWPAEPLDHVDGNQANNAITNLRLGSNGINQQNIRRPQRNNKAGFLGVCKRSDSNTYRACVSIGGKSRCFGGYQTPEEAHAAYLEKKRQLHAGCNI